MSKEVTIKEAEGGFILTEFDPTRNGDGMLDFEASETTSIAETEAALEERLKKFFGKDKSKKGLLPSKEL